MDDKRLSLIQVLLREYGITFAEEAGIVLKNEPAPLFQLLVLSLLLSASIRSGNAVQATRALRLEGLSTPQEMAQATWRKRKEVLANHGYKRHNDKTEVRLGRLGERVVGRYQGDLRRLEEAAAGDTARACELLQELGLGPVGATIFLREVQEVWPSLAPLVDQKVINTAAELGLAQSKVQITHLVPPDEFPKLVSALVRVWLDDSAGQVLRAASI